MQEEIFKPLDVIFFKKTVQQESVRLNLRSYSKEGESSFTLALALSAAIKKIFFEKSETIFSNEPQLEKKPITQFVHKMRVDAMEKFNSTTVFSAIQFAVNENGIQKQEYLLTLIAYLEKKFLPEFLRLLQYPYIDSDDDIECKDGCGTLINLFAGQYKREMSHLGYKDMMMSHFESYINTASDGVAIPKGVMEKYELSFEVEGVKRLVVEMATMAMLPKWQSSDKVAAKKILIVGDDSAFIQTIEPFLKAHGFDVLVANDGDEGKKKLKLKPELIIFDIQQSEVDGYEFIVVKKELDGDKEVPVIVMTAKDSVTDKLRIDGAREYLLKPFDVVALLKSIERYI